MKVISKENWDWVVEGALSFVLSIEFWFLAFLVALVVAMGYWASSISAKRDRLIAQCIADGRKEYECVALLSSRSSDSSTVLFMPMTVPARSR